MTKPSINPTMQLIADILSFSENLETLKMQFEHTTIDWDNLVVVASSYLMLPAIYCRLQVKDLLHLIPTELSEYLEEITKLNRQRNERLYAEAREISEIFNKEQIDYVFIKGMALIAGQTFNDPAERMLGDLDILVADYQLEQAFKLLTDHGYTETVYTVMERGEHRHLPRQISPQKLGAVELHNEILKTQYKGLIQIDQVLKNKRIVEGVAVPAIEDTIKMSILTFQINDRGFNYGYLSFKGIYDSLALNLPTRPELFLKLSHDKYASAFIEIASVFFKELTPTKTSIHAILLRRYFQFRLKNPKLGYIFTQLIKLYYNILFRIKLIFSSKSYIRHLLKNKIGLKFIK